MHERHEPGATLQHAHATLQQCVRELHVPRLVGLEQIPVVARGSVQTETDMKHQFEAGHLRLDACLLEGAGDTIA